MQLKEKFKDFIEENKEELYTILKEMCLIPAPSGFEDERAEYCKNKLNNAPKITRNNEIIALCPIFGSFKTTS